MARESNSPLWFLCSLSNPCRYKSRYRLYEAFRRHIVEQLGAQLCTVELALGGRRHEVTGDPSPREIHVQVRAESELFHKENLLNIGLARLPADCKYVCWIDTDIRFLRHDVLEELVHAMHRYRVVQPWRHCVDAGPDGEVMQTHTSWGYCVATDRPYSADPSLYGTTFQHCGYACCFHKSDLEAVGGFLDVGILGASDHHMAQAIVGRAHHTLPDTIHPNYRRAVLDWEAAALRVFQKDVGYVPGTIWHSFHGHKAKRQYRTRWNVLLEHAFDPLTDLRRNLQGVWELVGKPGLRDDIRRYFNARDEDSAEA